jgi:hypothetical protein
MPPSILNTVNSFSLVIPALIVSMRFIISSSHFVCDSEQSAASWVGVACRSCAPAMALAATNPKTHRRSIAILPVADLDSETADSVRGAYGLFAP